MGEKRGKCWQRHICIDRVVCGQWRPSVFECHLVLKGIVYFLWLFLVPVETRPAYTRRLDESRCVLHAATQPNKPEFHFTDCMESHESLKMSHRHLPIQAVSGVCECDAWVEASLRPCWVRILPVTMLCERKSAAFSLMLCAACVRFDIVVKERLYRVICLFEELAKGWALGCSQRLGSNKCVYFRKVQSPHLIWVKSRKVSSVKIFRKR